MGSRPLCSVINERMNAKDFREHIGFNQGQWSRWWRVKGQSENQLSFQIRNTEHIMYILQTSGPHSLRNAELISEWKARVEKMKIMPALEAELSRLRTLSTQQSNAVSRVVGLGA